MDPKRDAVILYENITKLLITLCTGAIALFPTFLNLAFSSRPLKGISNKCTLLIALLCFLLSIISGILTLQTIAGSLTDEKYTIYRKATRIASLVQNISFLLGMAGYTLFVFINI